ncbi:DUF7263 family protein [Halorubrum sp. DTA98]|uniref:DUF7263 family protein n=1 Tax=Halorubrum sp. DTA98 TaxID=3402163 RepID=UPI003AAE7A6F
MNGTDGGRTTGTRERRTTERATGSRGQTNLPVLAVALVVLTAVTGMTLAMAEGAYLSAERDANERGVTVSAADRFVAADADHTRRGNVLDAAALAEFTPADVTTLAPETDGADVRIRVGDETVVERGNPDGGTTVRRIALVAETDTWRGTTSTEPDDELTIPRRTGSLRIDIDGDVRTVRVNDRVVVHDPNGIDDDAVPVRVETSRYETLTAAADGNGGTVAVHAFPETTEKAIVAVTVDV